MNVVIVCQSCKKPLKIPVEGIGKKVRCPACKTVFVGRRDEFKPRPTSESERAQAAAIPPVRNAKSARVAPPANDAILADEDALDSGPDGEVLEDADALPVEDVLGEDETRATKRAAKRKKKKSSLPILLLLLGVFVFVAIVGGVAAYVLGVFG